MVSHHRPSYTECRHRPSLPHPSLLHSSLPHPSLRPAILIALVVLAVAATAASHPAGAAPRTVCDVQTAKTAAPTDLTLGQELEIRLRVDGRCPHVGQPGRADIMLSIDRSASQVDNGTWDDTVRAATAFVNLVDFSRHQVGVLSFSGAWLGLGPTTTLHHPLSSDGASVRAAVAGLPTPPTFTGGTNLVAAVEDAQAELASPRHRGDALPVIVLVSDGGHNVSTATTPVQAAQAARDAGTLVITVGLALDTTAADTLTAMASRPSLYFPAPSGADLDAIFRELAGSVGGTGRVTDLEIVDILPADVGYVAGSGEPPPSQVTATMLKWTLAELPDSGWTARYRILPQKTGTYATNKLAYVDYTDGDGSVGTRDFPVPMITVRQPGEPTAAPPTPTPWPYAAHLPLLYKHYCKPARPFDVALVLDTSSSMWGDKLDRTVQAARAFIGLLEMPPSRVAVLAFNVQSTVVQTLTGDRAGARSALDRLPRDEGSRIDLAVRAAVVALGAPSGDPKRLPVIILITDGKQVGGSDQDALNAGAEARRAGVATYTIGIGEDADATLLTRVAGTPDRYYAAPTADDLVRVYRAIAGVMPCELGR
jgi:Mg-chelatase subunit ChlD